MDNNSNDPWKKDPSGEQLNASQIFGLAIVLGIIAIVAGAYKIGRAHV
jgi:hypothetical protein